MASPPSAAYGFGVDPWLMPAVTHCTPGPYPPDLSRALLTGLQPLIHSRYATGLASRTRAIWQYQRVPALSGLLPTLTGAPRIRLPPASIRPLRQPNGRVSHPSRQSSASWRTQHRSTATQPEQCLQPNSSARHRGLLLETRGWTPIHRLWLRCRAAGPAWRLSAGQGAGEDRVLSRLHGGVLLQPEPRALSRD